MSRQRDRSPKGISHKPTDKLSVSFWIVVIFARSVDIEEIEQCVCTLKVYPEFVVEVSNESIPPLHPAIKDTIVAAVRGLSRCVGTEVAGIKISDVTNRWVYAVSAFKVKDGNS